MLRFSSGQHGHEGETFQRRVRSGIPYPPLPNVLRSPPAPPPSLFFPCFLIAFNGSVIALVHQLVPFPVRSGILVSAFLYFSPLCVFPPSVYHFFLEGSPFAGDMLSLRFLCERDKNWHQAITRLPCTSAFPPVSLPLPLCRKPPPFLTDADSFGTARSQPPPRPSLRKPCTKRRRRLFPLFLSFFLDSVFLPLLPLFT